jgi:MoxR-like ATPase
MCYTISTNTGDGENMTTLETTTTEITQELALRIAKTAFGDAAKVKYVSTERNPKRQYRVAFMPGGALAPTVCGYGSSWQEAFQEAFISPEGMARISECAEAGHFFFVTPSDDGKLESVQAVPQGEDINGFIQFSYDNREVENIPESRRVLQGFIVLRPENVFPNALSTASTASSVVVASATPKISVSRAYVNPNNIKTGLLGWDDDVTPAAVLAAITGEHLLVVGPPGNAKSLFARRFFANFEGNLFETQLSKYSDESQLFGAPNLKKLRDEGVFEYPKHGIAVADWGFLDEIFDASDVLLRTMLGILQEKKFTKSGHEEDIPLQSVIATANYTRVNEITAAVVDRFAFSVASPVLTLAQREMLYSKQEFESVTPSKNLIGIEQLRMMRAKAKEVEIPQSIIKTLVSWTTEMGFTPRRERKLASIIRANASLNGRKKADEHDILAARYCVPVSNSGQVQDAKKSLQPLKDAIMQALHEGEQLAQLGKWAHVHTATSDSPANVIKAIKATKVSLLELRGFIGVSEKVTAQKEKHIQAHDAQYSNLSRMLDI